MTRSTSTRKRWRRRWRRWRRRREERRKRGRNPFVRLSVISYNVMLFSLLLISL